MLRRRISGPGLRPCISTTRAPHASNGLLVAAPLVPGPPAAIRPRPAVGRRRWATTVTAAFQSTDHDIPASIPVGETDRDSNVSPLSHLLQAIQVRDAFSVPSRFVSWAESFAGPHDEAQAALKELSELPASTFSEILRWIDPIRNYASQDVAHGLNLSLGQALTTSSGMLVSTYGVRVHSLFMLNAVRVIRDARRETGRAMLIQDYEVFIRCAGAACDPFGATEMFGAIAVDGLAAERNTRTWTEYMKARFLTEPLYYQFDRARVAALSHKVVDPGIPYVSRHRTFETMMRMERLRYSLNSHRRRPFGRVWREKQRELRVFIGQSGAGPRTAFGHWVRAQKYGVLVDEEFLCATMIALGRASQISLIRGIILKRGFKLKIWPDEETGDDKVGGGRMFREGNPRAPSQRFLDAIVESLCSMSHVRLAQDCLVYAAQWYNITIPHHTWSNLLNWAFVCSSKPFMQTNKLKGGSRATMSTARLVRKVWDTMTVEYHIKPSFDDYVVYVKALVEQRNFRIVTDLLRDELVPHYRRVEEAHQNAVLEDVLENRTTPSLRRLQAEVQKEYCWTQIADIMRSLISTASKSAWQRSILTNAPFMATVLPDLIAEYGEFLRSKIVYRTHQGRVELTRPDVAVANRRFHMKFGVREMLPQKLGGSLVKRLFKDLVESGQIPAAESMDSPEASLQPVREEAQSPQDILEQTLKEKRRASGPVSSPSRADEQAAKGASKESRSRRQKLVVKYWPQIHPLTVACWKYYPYARRRALAFPSRGRQGMRYRGKWWADLREDLSV